MKIKLIKKLAFLPSLFLLSLSSYGQENVTVAMNTNIQSEMKDLFSDAPLADHPDSLFVVSDILEESEVSIESEEAISVVKSDEITVSDSLDELVLAPDSVIAEGTSESISSLQTT